MMNKKSLIRVVLLVTLSLGIFLSCSQEDSIPAAPTVEIIHLGTDESPDDRIFYTGVPAHIEVKIIAPGRIQKIELEINQKSGYGNNSITRVYPFYVGHTEIPTFHDHSEVDKDIAIGEYHFQLKVTDQQGNIATIESDVTIKPGDGHEGGHNHDG